MNFKGYYCNRSFAKEKISGRGLGAMTNWLAVDWLLREQQNKNAPYRAIDWWITNYAVCTDAFGKALYLFSTVQIQSRCELTTALDYVSSWRLRLEAAVRDTSPRGVISLYSRVL
jgi:hypothetical protein